MLRTVGAVRTVLQCGKALAGRERTFRVWRSASRAGASREALPGPAVQRIRRSEVQDQSPQRYCLHYCHHYCQH